MRYTVTAERGSGGRWLFQCREFPGALSEGRRLTDAERLMPEAIAFVADVPAQEVTVELEVILDEDLREQVDRARRSVSEVSQAQREAAALSRQAARDLVAAGLSGVDTAAVLHLSPQRVSQLVNSG